jgi:hypothetical protein
VNDHLARALDRIHNQINAVEDGRDIFVADQNQGWGGDLPQPPDRRRIQLVHGCALKIVAHVAAVHVEEQLADLAAHVTASAARPIEKEARLCLVQSL